MEKKNSHLRDALKFLMLRRKLPVISILVPLIVYGVLYLCRVYSLNTEDVIRIGGGVLPISSLTGAISLLSSIILVIMVLYYRKTGFIISILLIAAQLPKLLILVFFKHNLTGISGIFTVIFTIITLVIVYKYQLQMEKEQMHMRNLFEQTATALVNAIDAKDKYTHGHSSRVAEYSRRLAEMNHKSKTECDKVYYTALLHDVGKIGVPNNIINKVGKLTPEEYQIVKQHPEKGSQILETISGYPYLSIGAYYHHERYDGKGYPAGLKGEEIPEIARIAAVADAYDAMTSIRSYRDPIPQDKVREEIVKGIGTQFDPDYARLMLHLIDVDTEYNMKERASSVETDRNSFAVGEYRSVVAPGIHITSRMTTIYMTVGPDDELTGAISSPSLILFDSLDGVVHSKEKYVRERLYFEYGEIWLDGRTAIVGARKIQQKTDNTGSPEIKNKGRFKIEAVRIKDHAQIRVSNSEQTTEVIAALPDSTRYLYIGITGEHCRISDLITERAASESAPDLIPRIAEEISYINVPAGDVPNVQIDGFRSDASEGIEVRDGLRLSFHTKSLPTARLVWHCPFILLFCSDNGRVRGVNYRELAFMRFDGESWESDPKNHIILSVRKNDSFVSWDSWMQFNRDGYDAVVTFRVEGSRITMITENAGISVKSTAVLSGIDRKIYAAVTGDQVAVTNIRIGN